MHDIRLLRTFLAVYRAGTFTRAARDLHLTQPAVSVQIRALEQQVGKPLFQRATTGATPTAAGRELARAIAPHVDALQSALAGASAGAHSTEATLYIGGPEEFLAERVLPVLVSDMLDGLRLRMFFDVDAPVIDRLLAGELDIAVLTYDLRRRGIESVHLCFEHLELVGTPRWRERLHALEPGPAGAEQLESVPIASYAEDLPLVDDYWQGVFGTPARLRAAFVANGLRTCLRFAIAGAGITVLPDHTSAAALERGDLVHILDPLMPPRSPLYLAWRSGSLRRPALASVHERIVAASVDW